jgi:hypothetical protein
MQDRIEEFWMQLCREAVTEQNPDRLLEIVDQINRMLLEREQLSRGRGRLESSVTPENPCAD